MSVLSLTYHCPEALLNEWEAFLDQEFNHIINQIKEVEHYLLSEVYSEMITEGKNYNLLLIFSTEAQRQAFLETGYPEIRGQIDRIFGQEVMDFVTLLDPKIKRLG